MARIWSARLRSMAARAGWKIQGLLDVGAVADRHFMVVLITAHLLISLLGAAHLAATLLSDSGPHGFFIPSLALFVLTGTFAAVLLGHLGVAMDQDLRPKPRHAEIRILPSRKVSRVAGPQRRVLSVSPACEIAIDRPQAAAHSRAEAALTALMGQISHEIRTPLNAIIGFSDLMQRELMGPLGSPRYREYARHIRESGLAVLKAAEETMMLAALVKEPHRSSVDVVDVGTLIDTACRTASAGASTRRIEIECSAGSACRTSADPRALHQALSNLVSAAVLRAPDGATIHVTTQPSQLDILIETKGSSAGSQPGSAQLSDCIGNALLELQGATVKTERLHNGDWRTTAAFLPVPASETSRRNELRQRIIRHRAPAVVHRLHA